MCVNFTNVVVSNTNDFVAAHIKACARSGYPPTLPTQSWQRRWRLLTFLARLRPMRPSASGGGCWAGAWRRSAPAAGARSALTCCSHDQAFTSKSTKHGLGSFVRSRMFTSRAGSRRAHA